MGRELYDRNAPLELHRPLDISAQKPFASLGMQRSSHLLRAACSRFDLPARLDLTLCAAALSALLTNAPVQAQEQQTGEVQQTSDVNACSPVVLADGDNYCLTFSDDFDVLDLSRWKT